MSDDGTVEVAKVLARLKIAQEHAADEDLALVPGLVHAQAIIRELEGWPVEDESRLT
jgi:hypothetical protein